MKAVEVLVPANVARFPAASDNGLVGFALSFRVAVASRPPSPLTPVMPTATVHIRSVEPETGLGSIKYGATPSPSCPDEPRPQHDPSPLMEIAHVCKLPGRTDVTCPRPEDNVTGVLAETRVPFPIWPESFPPQQSAFPLVSTPHVVARPASIRDIDDRTTVGDAIDREVPSPIWPDSFAPQQ